MTREYEDAALRKIAEERDAARNAFDGGDVQRKVPDDARGELLACPFCGEPPYARAIGGPRGLHIIGCKNDGCEINPKASGETSHEVAETWNTRAAPVPQCDAEPVAWRWRFNDEAADDWDLRKKRPKIADDLDVICEPLYATPPSRSDAVNATVPSNFTPGDPVEIRLQNDSIDEIVIRRGDVHIEQMSDDSWFMGVDASDGSYWQFWFGAKNRKSHVEFRHTETVPAARAALVSHPSEAGREQRQQDFAVGSALDEWDRLSNDERGEIKTSWPLLANAMQELKSAFDNA